MKPSTKTFLAVALLISLLWMWRERSRERTAEIETEAAEVQESPPATAPSSPRPAPVVQITPKAAIETSAVPTPRASSPAVKAISNAKAEGKTDAAKKPPEFALKFVIEDGHAVVEGDIVLGRPEQDDGSVSEGWAVVPKMNLWPTTRIPYHIQPHLPNPERVHEAIALFSSTVIEFFPYSGQEQDVLIFESGTGHCKSYVGHIGGKQPIWLSPGCGPREIAHEILHALGFIHEQNRADRDGFIEVISDAVDPRFAGNFERFPMDFMRVSGLAPFDFESIMIYPPWMFAKQGRSTMRPLDGSNRIIPGESLSPADIERLRQAYTGRPR